MNIDDLIQQIRTAGNEVWVAGPQTEAAIQVLARALNIKLPSSYRGFVARYGSVIIYDSVISGICNDEPLSIATGWMYGDTLRFRDRFNLPTHLAIIQPDDEATFCLDTHHPDGRGEFPVVCYELRSGHVSRLADGFDQWLRAWCEQWT